MDKLDCDSFKEERGSIASKRKGGQGESPCNEKTKCVNDVVMDNKIRAMILMIVSMIQSYMDNTKFFVT